MTRNSSKQARQRLKDLVLTWTQDAKYDIRDHHPYVSILEEVLFHADLRYVDYLQYQSDGTFLVRLINWINNVSDTPKQQVMFRMLLHLTFIDQKQIHSLMRDAYRRIIAPWLLGPSYPVSKLVDDQYYTDVLKQLRHYHLCSITESFNFPDFQHVNDLHGLQRPVLIGDTPKELQDLLHFLDPNYMGLIILEDFVGTGKQSMIAIRRLLKHLPPHWRLLFCPLMCLPDALVPFGETSALGNVSIQPVVVLTPSTLIKAAPISNEPTHVSEIRALVKHTADTVLESLDELDDVPTDPFGYGGCGALIVTSHNTPNNTLPLIHHRAPKWQPLFRRLHHAKGAGNKRVTQQEQDSDNR